MENKETTAIEMSENKLSQCAPLVGLFETVHVAE